MLAMIYPDNYPAQFPFVIKDFVATRVTRSFIELSIWSFLFSLVAPPEPDYGETITVSGINVQCGFRIFRGAWQTLLYFRSDRHID